MKIQGRTSQSNPLKGLHIIARDKYGKSTIDYPLFKDGKSKANKLTSFKRFMIRAWGSVFNQGMVNDALAHTGGYYRIAYVNESVTSKSFEILLGWYKMTNIFNAI